MDVATFESLLRTQRNRVFSYAVYVLGNRQDAEDVTQEAFVRVWERCPAVGNDAVLAWLRRVVRNLCIDLQRRRRRWRERELDMEAGPFAERIAEAHGPGLDPERQLLRRERQRALLELMTEMPAETSELLWLHYFEGLKYREIASITGTHPTTVKVQVHRARRVLRQRLTHCFADENADRPVVGLEMES